MRRALAFALLFSLFLSADVRASALQAFVIRLHRHHSIGVLLFHQVSDDPIMSAHGVDRVQEPWTSPSAFDAFLDTLQRQGYHVIPMRTALAYFEGARSGASLPSKPVILTFDDGYRSAWTVATPILEKHHATATMFFEGHATDNPAIPGRLNESDLRAMAASGVWTLESHGWAGHSNVQLDARGTLSPYWYANLAWLPSKRRLETRAEFEERVEADLRRMRTVFAPVTGAPITVFAYPSGEYGQNAPLSPGADPRTLIEAGHSNASGLTPYLLTALRNAGYRAAFAVSLPDAAHFASRADNVYELPRLGIGARFDPHLLAAVAGERGIEYPEAADGQIADPGPICAHRRALYVAATNRPALFRLDDRGRFRSVSIFDALRSGRASGRAEISGLACYGNELVAVQQAGFDANPRPYLDRFSIGPDGVLSLRSRDALPPPMNWLVGIARVGPALFALDDRGALFDVGTERQVALVDPAVPANTRHTRFTGLAARAGLLYTIDTAENQVIAFTTDGTVVARAPIDSGSRDLAFDRNRLLVSYWTNDVRSMREYDLVAVPHA